MNPRDIKRRANAIRKCLIDGATHYYDRKYKDLRVADLLLVLEDDNYHSEEVVLEALATLDYYFIVEACRLEVEHDKISEMDFEDKDRARLSDENYERRRKLLNKMEKGEN